MIYLLSNSQIPKENRLGDRVILSSVFLGFIAIVALTMGLLHEQEALNYEHTFAPLPLEVIQKAIVQKHFQAAIMMKIALIMGCTSLALGILGTYLLKDRKKYLENIKAKLISGIACTVALVAITLIMEGFLRLKEAKETEEQLAPFSFIPSIHELIDKEMQLAPPGFYIGGSLLLGSALLQAKWGAKKSRADYLAFGALLTTAIFITCLGEGIWHYKEASAIDYDPFHLLDPFKGLQNDAAHLLFTLSLGAGFFGLFLDFLAIKNSKHNS